MNTTIFRTGVFFALLAVILGAFGAHAIKTLVNPSLLEAWHTGVQYQFYHAFALLICAIISKSITNKKVINLAFLFFVAGIVLFSGSLYFMVLVSIHGKFDKHFGLITPIGGLFFIAGWISLLFSRF